MSKTYYLQHNQQHYFTELSDVTKLFCDTLIYEKADGSQQQKRYSYEQIKDRNDSIVLKVDQIRTQSYTMKPNIVNLNSTVYAKSSLKEQEQLWQQYGLSVKHEIEGERLFLVTIFELHMLSWHRVNSKLEPIGQINAVERGETGLIAHNGSILLERTVRQLEVAAARALYAVELDAGAALIAVGGTGGLVIRQVWSLLHLPVRFEAELIFQGFELYEKSLNQQKTQADVLIGADPEFVLLNEHNKVVSAATFFEGLMQDEIGADAIMYRGEIVYPLVEVRPAPQRQPRLLLREIKLLLQEANEYIRNEKLMWLAGAMPYNGIALGGHIHLSGVVLTPRLLRILDRCVAMVLAAIEDPKGRGRYRRYGALGDYRRQPHGGFEYRTPPSWLVSPAVAKSALAMAYASVRSVNTLCEYELYNRKWVDAYYSGDYELLAECSIQALEWMNKLDVTGVSKDDFQAIMEAIAQKKQWNEQIDIRKRWGIL